MGAPGSAAALPLAAAMEKPYRYEICIQGHLAERWSDWFDGMAIRTEPDGTTILVGEITDQAALFGLLNKIQSLQLTLVSVVPMPSTDPAGG